MKRLLLGFLLMCAVSSFAQKTKYGVKMGLNIATLEGDAFDDVDSRYGFAAGFFAQIPLSGSLEFQPELLYSGQGIKPNSLDGGGFAERAELDYLQLPLLVRYNMGKFNIHAGPQAGLTIWNSYNKGLYSNYDVSALAGIGVQVIGGFSVEARYSLGFTDVVNTQAEGKNRYFAFMVSYSL